MFQDGSDGVPTDSPQTLGAGTGEDPHARTAERSGRTGDSPSKSNSPNGRGTRALANEAGAAGCSSVTQPANTFPVCNTGPGKAQVGYLPGRLQAAGATGRGALPAESAPTGRLAETPRDVRPEKRIVRGGRHRPPTAEFRGSTLWSHPFASKRFHVLLNSLFKVLFNFPSRYLFAIGLVSVFSLRWSLPPALGCIPKQPDSGAGKRDGSLRPRGLTPAVGKVPIRRTRTPAGRPKCRPAHHRSRRPCRPRDSVLGSSLFTRRY